MIPIREMMQPENFESNFLLLHYPDQALLDHLSEVQVAVTETETALQPGRLAALYQHLGQGDLYLLEENYVALFRPWSRHLALLLSMFMVNRANVVRQWSTLLTMYGESVLICRCELPDYLPVFLEYLAAGFCQGRDPQSARCPAVPTPSSALPRHRQAHPG